MSDSRIKTTLLSILRGNLGQNSDESAKSLSDEEWQELLDLARIQAISPLLYQKLKIIEEVEVPAKIMQELQNDYLLNLARNMILFHKLVDILKRCNEEKIPVIPLKGAYLAEHIYNSIGVRTMSDIDILVKQEDLQRVEQILLSNGFQPEQGVREIFDNTPHFGYTLVENNQPMMIEVHWDLIPARDDLPVDIKSIWKNSRPSEINTVPAYEMAPEDLLLHLSVHASKHVFQNGLRMVYDIAETLRHFEKEIDWPKLQQAARK